MTAAPSPDLAARARAPASDVETACANCGERLHGAYCHRCGQEARDPDPTARELAQEAFEELSSVDGKLLRTVRALVVQPGRLTAEYIAGRRAAYVAPLKLYLWMSVLFFFVTTLVPKERRELHLTTTSSVAGKGDARPATPAASTDTATSAFEREFERKFGQAQRNEGAFFDEVQAWMPRAMFALVPVFALLLGLVYRSRRMRYPRHLFFSFHLHAFAFGLLAASELAKLVPGKVVEGLVAIAVTIVLPVYTVKALRRVYGGTTGNTVARAALLAALYFPVYLVALGLLIVGVVMTF